MQSRHTRTDNGVELKVFAFEHNAVILEIAGGSHYSSVHVTHDEAMEYCRKIHAAINAATPDEMDNSVEESARKTKVTPSGIEE